MIPVNTLEFTSLKRVGIVSEIAVCECVHLNAQMRQQLHTAFDVDTVIATTRVKLDAPYDIELWTFTTGIEATQGMHTVEVKSAQNGGRYPTFLQRYIRQPPGDMLNTWYTLRHSWCMSTRSRTCTTGTQDRHLSMPSNTTGVIGYPTVEALPSGSGSKPDQPSTDSLQRRSPRSSLQRHTE